MATQVRPEELVQHIIDVGAMIITDVEPGQAVASARLTYSGLDLGLVDTAHFKDDKGATKTSPASSTSQGRGAQATLPTGLSPGHGTTWLSGGGQNSNTIPMDFITD